MLWSATSIEGLPLKICVAPGVFVPILRWSEGTSNNVKAHTASKALDNHARA